MILKEIFKKFENKNIKQLLWKIPVLICDCDDILII